MNVGLTLYLVPRADYKFQPHKRTLEARALDIPTTECYITLNGLLRIFCRTRSFAKISHELSSDFCGKSSTSMTYKVVHQDEVFLRNIVEEFQYE